jgi:hypothetical protein
MPYDHTKCGHPATKDARAECREKKGLPGRGAPSDKPEQIRSRARRHQKKMESELTKLYRKPVEEWDMEELAHGKPRASDGTFKGVPPKWVTRQVHEEAVRRFKQMLNSKVRVLSVPAIEMLLQLMTDDRMVFDDEGQPVRHLVPPSVKSQIGTFLIEHVIGKPNQTVDAKGELVHSVQSILAGSMVNPDQDADEALALSMGEDDDGDDDEPDDEDVRKLIIKPASDE